MEDDGCVAAEFEADFLFSGGGFELPADGGAAGEADHGDALVGDESVDVFVGAGDDVYLPGGDSGFDEDVGEEEHGEGAFGRGFYDDAVAAGDGGGNFVGGEIEGEIERGDACDDADGKAAHDAEMAVAGGKGIHVEHLAVLLAGFFGGGGEGHHGAIDFGFGEGDGLACFGDDGVCEVGFAQCDAVRDGGE